jgi:hypothetical protein
MRRIESSKRHFTRFTYFATVSPHLSIPRPLCVYFDELESIDTLPILQ